MLFILFVGGAGEVENELCLFELRTGCAFAARRQQ